MSPYPATHLVVGPAYSVLCTGPWLHVLDSATGALVHAEDTGLPIRVLAVDAPCAHIVTTADNKRLVVRQRAGLKVLSTRELPKRATAIVFDSPGSLLVADKFGDVFRFPLHPSPSPSSAVPAVPTDTAHAASSSEKPSPESELILGHVSIVTALQLAHDGRHIITGDRDEHVRVSRFPQSFVVERFLFGHRRYVSALHIPSFAPSTLVSGGGDPALFVWDWRAGELVQKVGYGERVRPFMRVKARKRARAVGGKRKGKGVGVGVGMEKGPTTGEDGVGANGTPGEGMDVDVDEQEQLGGKEQPEAEAEGGGAGDGAGDGDGDAEEEAPQWGRSLAEVTGPDDPDVVFAVKRIAGLEAGGETAILFSLVGCSALLYTPFPLPPAPAQPAQVNSLNFGKPIVDFCVAGPRVWVAVDMGWPAYEAGGGVDVRLVEWEGGALVPRFEDGEALLGGMNACAHAATAPEIRSLEMYAELLLLPKYGEEPEGAAPPGPRDRPGAKSEGRKKTREALARVGEGGEGGKNGNKGKRQRTEG